MSEDSEGVPRRYMLQTLGAAGAAGLAGCSSGGDNGSNPTTSAPEETETYEDTTTQTETSTPAPEVEHVPLGQWPQQYLLPASQNDGAVMFDSWSPSQFEENFGVTPVEFSYLKHDDTPAYENVSFSPGDVPESFLHRRENSSYVSDVKVDQLPGGVTGQDVATDLRENDYEKVNEIGGFDIYSKTAAESVHAVSEDRHAFAADIMGGSSTKQALTTQHRNYLEQVLNEKSGQNSQVPQEVDLLKNALGPKDTFAAVNQEGYEKLRGLSGERMMEDIVEFKQPSFGGTSVDVEEGLKYGAWILDDAEQAEAVYNSLMDKGVRNGWENIDYEGRVLTAAGQIDMESRIKNSGHIQDGLLSVPRI